MKILIYCGYQQPWDSVDPDHSSLGGSEKATLELYNKLADNGHHVMVVGQGLDVYSKHVREANHLSHEYVDEHWDVVIAVNYAHFLRFLDDNQMSYDKLIFWLHNEEPFFYIDGEEDLSLIESLYDDRVNDIITVSETAAEKLRAVHPDIAYKIDYIPNGINYGITHTVGDKTPNTFMYSSCPSRGLGNVLDMWPTIVGSMQNAELHICFPSYAEEYYLEQFEQRVLEMQHTYGMDSIVVHGSLPQHKLYAVMTDVEYWLYPSNYFETFCITALEMMAHRVKIIACEAGNVGALVGDDNGILIDYTDDSDLLTQRYKAAIEYAEANHNEMYERLNNAQDFAQQLDWSNVANDWEDLLGVVRTEEVSTDLPTNSVSSGRVGFLAGSPVYSESAPNPQGCPVEAVYVIGLDRTADWEDIDNRIKSMNLGNDVIIHKVPAVDGRTLTLTKLNADGVYTWDKWRLDSTTTDNGWWTRDMTMGEIGCACSHLSVWTDVKERGYNNVLVLEEDFDVRDGYHTYNWDSLPIDYNIFFLGRNAFGGPDAEIVNDDVVRPYWHYNTQAYMLNAYGAAALVNSHFERNIIPVDEYLGIFWARTDLPRNDIFELPHETLNVYAVPQDREDLIGQTSVTGLNSSTEGNSGVEDRLHPELYTFWENRQEWTNRFISPGIVHREWDLLVDEPLYGVLEMPLFTEEFCVMIREEAEHAQSWTTDRHEFYPTTDMLLQAIDMHDIYMAVLREFVMPMAIHCWNMQGEGWDTMYAENFLARYIPEAQGHLSLHHDNSDITALVNLSKPGVEFEGGGTYFDRVGKVSQGKQGYVCVHPGRVTHRHGARPVTSGSRYILVSFMSNTDLR